MGLAQKLTQLSCLQRDYDLLRETLVQEQTRLSALEVEKRTAVQVHPWRIGSGCVREPHARQCGQAQHLIIGNGEKRTSPTAECVAQTTGIRFIASVQRFAERVD